MVELIGERKGGWASGLGLRDITRAAGDLGILLCKFLLHHITDDYH